MTHDATRRALLTASVQSALLLLVPVSGRVLAAAPAAPLSPEDRATLLLVARRLYPHDGLPDEPYLGVVDALAGAAQDPNALAVIRAGLEQLDAVVDGSWRGASAEAQTAALARIADEPFFAVVRQTTAFALYNNPLVWERFGYGGDAWRFGGYLNRGLADIDWLPHPA
ncbi:MAG TPA: hypothetical protein VLT59_12130 [Steroidobacteraceae bacterium]|nr:hypothetical protein [Steroidobacteraceae bacterium]